MEGCLVREFNEAILIASGPSLTQEQIDLAFRWRSQGSGRIIMVINRTFERIPDADILFTMDGKFLKNYEQQIKETFKGEVMTHKIASHKPDWVTVIGATTSGNSGSAGIEALDMLGCRKVYLLGCDGKYADDGKRHHHDDYPKEGPCGNADNIHEYPGCFRRAVKRVKNLKIIQCSPGSALGFLTHMPLHKALNMDVGLKDEAISGEINV